LLNVKKPAKSSKKLTLSSKQLFEAWFFGGELVWLVFFFDHKSHDPAIKQLA
jgi:hypothetical protein